MTQDTRILRLMRTPNEKRRFDLISELVREDEAKVRELASELIHSEAVGDRSLGADIMGQLGTVQPEARAAIVDTILPRLAREHDGAVLESMVVALGHARDPRSRRAVMSLAQHDDPAVRFAVAFALPSLGIDDETAPVLRSLAADPDSRVRDWATFGLAESALEDQETIAVLFERARDPDDDTRAEGIFGLARRHDPRARALVDQELSKPGTGELVRRAREELDAG